MKVKCDMCRFEAEFKHEGEYLCADCLVEKLIEDGEIEESSSTRYFGNGEFLAEDDTYAAIVNLESEEIEIL